MIARLSPMLAAQAEPFDSDDHLFEVKWDGVRALVAVEAGQWRAWGRELSDYAPHYPELEMVRSLPDGVALDTASCWKTIGRVAPGSRLGPDGALGDATLVKAAVRPTTPDYARRFAITRGA